MKHRGNERIGKKGYGSLMKWRRSYRQVKKRANTDEAQENAQQMIERAIRGAENIQGFKNETDLDSLLQWMPAVPMLSEQNLTRAILFRAILVEANMFGANLSYATLITANLDGANLQEASLRYADLRGADLRKADLTGADLDGALLPKGWVFVGSDSD